MKKLYVPRKQLKVYIPLALDREIRHELSKGEIKDKPAYGDMSKLVTLLLKKWLTRQQRQPVAVDEQETSLREFL